MAQFIRKEPIEFRLMPDNTLSCYCGHMAREFVTVMEGKVMVKLPVCRWHAVEIEADPSIVPRLSKNNA